MENSETVSIVKELENYFAFLYDKGFGIRLAEYSPEQFGNWVVAFESSTCVIFITSDRNHLLLEFSPIKDLDVSHRMTVEEIIYSISKGKITVEPFSGNFVWDKEKQLERLSKLLAQYIDKITPCFDNDAGKFLNPKL